METLHCLHGKSTLGREEIVVQTLNKKDLLLSRIFTDPLQVLDDEQEAASKPSS